MVKAAGEMEQNLKGAIKTVEKHLGSMKAADEKEEKKKRALQEREAMEQNQQDLKKRTDAARAAGSRVVAFPAVFSAGRSCFKKFELASSGVVKEADQLLVPLVISGGDALSAWWLDKEVQQVMTAYGSKYKKQDKFKQTGKMCNPLIAKQGKEPTEKMAMNDEISTA